MCGVEGIISTYRKLELRVHLPDDARKGTGGLDKLDMQPLEVRERVGERREVSSVLGGKLELEKCPDLRRPVP